ncbi:MAG: hypothetical protein WBB42_06100 [Polyangiales bacterium]
MYSTKPFVVPGRRGIRYRGLEHARFRTKPFSHRIEGGNPARTESNEEARHLDMRLRELWSQHPNFHFVPHSASFFAKLQAGLRQLQAIVDHNGLLHKDS